MFFFNRKKVFGREKQTIKEKENKEVDYSVQRVMLILHCVKVKLTPYQNINVRQKKRKIIHQLKDLEENTKLKIFQLKQFKQTVFFSFQKLNIAEFSNLILKKLSSR